MSLVRTVLLVSSTSRLSRSVTPFIQRAGCHVVLAGNFQSAKLQMDAAPDLVITELKLGEYNGLQLALRGRATGTPVIVLADESYEHEVEQLGAVWMSPEAAASDELRPVLTELLQHARSLESGYEWLDSSGDHAARTVVIPESAASRYLH
jgi:DNA-binding response OmpR family regulator